MSRSQATIGGFVLVGLAVALVAAMGLSYLASANPDGLESAVRYSHCGEEPTQAAKDACLAKAAGDPVFDSAPLPDYQSGWVSGLVGVLACMALGTGLVLLTRGGPGRTRGGAASAR